MSVLRAVLSPRSARSKQEEPISYTGWPLKEKHLPGELHEFELLTTLGTGTFGRVRLARHKSSMKSTKFYAIKTLKKELLWKQRQVEHIKNEISLLASINHPFIVNLVNNFHDEKKIFMVLEYVPGGELFSILRAKDKLSDNEAKFYAAQIATAFFYLHGRRISYRDLKPENVLVTETGYLKLTDFGFAKVIEDRSWTLCGTPEYLAPEIVTGKGHGLGVDWWAFGVFIYEMLAGIPPFYDESHVGVYQKILSGKLSIPPFVSSKCSTLVRKLLQRDLSQRAGCMKNGISDVKKASWFSSMNWEALEKQELPVFYIPPLQGEGDTSNFDDYPEGDDDAYDNIQVTTADGVMGKVSEKDIYTAFQELDSIGFAPFNVAKQHIVSQETQRLASATPASSVQGLVINKQPQQQHPPQQNYIGDRMHQDSDQSHLQADATQNQHCFQNQQSHQYFNHQTHFQSEVIQHQPQEVYRTRQQSEQFVPQQQVYNEHGNFQNQYVQQQPQPVWIQSGQPQYFQQCQQFDQPQSIVMNQQGTTGSHAQYATLHTEQQEGKALQGTSVDQNPPPGKVQYIQVNR